jgi:GR25 family glycosyltransferase involved in LPS biosynthesis
MKLFDFVDYAAYINLDKRVDRKIALEKHFQEIGILQYVNRISAITPAKIVQMLGMPHPIPTNVKMKDDFNAHCCWVSHAIGIGHAQRLNCKNALIFEDDVFFYTNDFYNPVDLVTSALAQLKTIKEWDVIYLGGFADPHNKLSTYELVSPNLMKVEQVYGVHAVLYNHTVFEKLLYDVINFDINKAPLPADEYLDREFKNRYMIYPLAASQREDFFSDISSGNRRDYNMPGKWVESYKRFQKKLKIAF